MTTLAVKFEPLVVDVRFTNVAIGVVLADARSVAKDPHTPLVAIPRLRISASESGALDFHLVDFSRWMLYKISQRLKAFFLVLETAFRVPIKWGDTNGSRRNQTRSPSAFG